MTTDPIPPDPPPAETSPAAPDLYRRTVRYGRRLAATWGLAASLVTVAVIVTVMGASYAMLLLGIGACLGASLGAPLLWSLLAPNGRSFRVSGGIAAGILAVLLAHMAMWLVMIGGIFLADVALADYPEEVPGLLSGVLFLAWMSVFVVGYATVPAGAIVGLLVTLTCRRRLRKAEEAMDPR